MRRPFIGIAALALILAPAPAFAQAAAASTPTASKPSDHTDATGPIQKPNSPQTATRVTPEEPIKPALGAGARQKPQNSGHLAGDWLGLLPKLENIGIVPTIGYKVEAAWNARGGDRRDVTAPWQLDFGAALNLEQILGAKGSILQITITKRNGPGLNDNAGLHLLEEAQEVFGRDPVWRTSELWFQHRNAADTVIFKIGRFPGGDFDSWGCDFTSLGICSIRAGTANNYIWYDFPIAEWGGWLKVRNDKVFVHAGVTEDNPRNLDTGFFLAKFHGARGALFRSEFGWTPVFGSSLVGLYQVGGWYATSKRPDTYLGADGRPIALTGETGVDRRGPRGIYAQGQQQITGYAAIDAITNVMTPTRGLTLGFNWEYGDHRTSTIIDEFSFEAMLTAPFPTRPADQIGLAVGSSRYAPRAADTAVLRDPLLGRPKREYRVEAYYRVLVTQGLLVRPNVQYIADPGGYSARRDAVILGLRADVTL